MSRDVAVQIIVHVVVVHGGCVAVVYFIVVTSDVALVSPDVAVLSCVAAVVAVARDVAVESHIVAVWSSVATVLDLGVTPNVALKSYVAVQS